MNGLIRLMYFTTQDRIVAQQRRDDEALRAWRRQPDALPDEPSGLIRRERRPVRQLARLVARIGAG